MQAACSSGTGSAAAALLFDSKPARRPRGGSIINLTNTEALCNSTPTKAGWVFQRAAAYYNRAMERRSIAVLGGTGRQGRGIARRLANAGYRIIVGSRDPARAAEAVHEWNQRKAAVATASYGDAIADAEVVVLAVPFDTVAATLEDHRTRFGAAVIVDVTVPVVFAAGTASLADVAEGSAAEHVRARAPSTVGVAAAFKTIPAHVLDDATRPIDCDEFVCGDTPDARAVGVELVEAMDGLRAIDVGPLSRARSIEHLTLLAIGINRRLKIHDARFRVVGV